MLKKIMIVVWMLAIIPLLASADPLIMVSVNSYETPSQITDIAVFEFNNFDDPRFFEDQIEDSESIELVLEDGQGDVISRTFLSGYSTIADFDQSIIGIKIQSGELVLAQKTVSFCNGNGVCEPCEGLGCILIENTLTCSDCRTGSQDFFCDTVEDGICDPDCETETVDPDCESVCSQDCGIDINEWPECEGYGGTICEYNEDCVGGVMEYASDSMYCCVGGFCAIQGEYVEARAVLEEWPSLDITPRDVTPGPVTETMLEPEEYPEEVFPNLPEGEFPHAGVAELGEEPSIISAERIEEIAISAEEAIGSIEINLFHVALILLGILFVIMVFTALFKRRASVEMSVEEKAVEVNPQSEIDKLIAEGKNYRQIDQMLIAKGFEKSFVESEIRKNYQNRLALQRYKKAR